jgi:hypothetical protein
MASPSSFCTMCTHTCCFEFIGLVYSLSLHHPGAKFYCMLDSKTKEELDNLTLKPNLTIIVKVELDKYSNKGRQQMVHENIWDEFQMQKANVIKHALEYENDTMFLDSDVLILNPINNIDKSKQIGVSPHYIKKSNTDEVGYYNGGCLWTQNKIVPDDWIEFTKTSRYHDQASIEDLVKKYSYQEFGEEINFMPWRVLLANNPNEVVNNINIKNNNINYKDTPLIFLHTHFLDQRFAQVNNIFLNALRKLKRYKELAIIDRIINKQWIIKIPKQPQMGIWRHTNDSFRELALLYQKNNRDIKIELTDNGHCWIGNHILLYDRPTGEWFNQDLVNSSLILLGNGDINIEGNHLKQQGLIVKPWVFWPRRPFIMEKFLATNSKKQYNERTIDSIFIGNIENSIQNKYRNSQDKWENVLTEYHCTSGTQHKFSQEEYLEKLSCAKYGLALRGYGSKCHREVELMALGTVPIVTPEVSIQSYMNPPQENIHYITAKTPTELKEKVQSITQEQWETMSKNCYTWYQTNVYSKNSMNTILTNILYT